MKLLSKLFKQVQLHYELIVNLYKIFGKNKISKFIINKIIYKPLRKIIVRRDRKIEKEILKNEAAYEAAMYSNILKFKFKKAIPFIIKNPEAAVIYAASILNKRWLDAEKYILNNPEACYMYACEVINGEWPEAEKTIFMDNEITTHYAISCKKQRIKEKENDIFKTEFVTDYLDRFFIKLKDGVYAVNSIDELPYGDAFEDILYFYNNKTFVGREYMLNNIKIIAYENI